MEVFGTSSHTPAPGPHCFTRVLLEVMKDDEGVVSVNSLHRHLRDWSDRGQGYFWEVLTDTNDSMVLATN